MKKILIIVLILFFVFAFIRITTSIYENKKRRDNAQGLSVSEHSIITNNFDANLALIKTD